MKNQVSIGVSKKVLDVSKGVKLAGYMDRSQGNLGIYDPVYTKALAISNGLQKTIIITNDILGLDEEIVKAVVLKIQAELAIEEKDIFICATHTHSGPEIIEWMPGVNLDTEHKKLKKRIIDDIAKNAIESTKELIPSHIKFGKSEINDLGTNRINKDVDFDNSVNVISFNTDEDKPICIIVNHACHPTILGSNNLLVSADYPGVVQRKVEQKYGQGCICMFMNGACGDISTRFTRRGQDFIEVERMGALLFNKVIEAIDRSLNVDGNEIKCIKDYFYFPKKELPDYDEAVKHYEEAKLKRDLASKGVGSLDERRLAETKYQGASITLKLLETLDDDYRINAPIQVIKIGNIVIVGVPVELFNEFGLSIKSSSKLKNILVAGYTNDMLGYVYTKESYENGDYEAWSSIFGGKAGDFIVDNSLKLIENIIQD